MIRPRLKRSPEISRDGDQIAAVRKGITPYLSGKRLSGPPTSNYRRQGGPSCVSLGHQNNQFGRVHLKLPFLNAPDQLTFAFQRQVDIEARMSKIEKLGAPPCTCRHRAEADNQAQPRQLLRPRVRNDFVDKGRHPFAHDF